MRVSTDTRTAEKIARLTAGGKAEVGEKLKRNAEMLKTEMLKWERLKRNAEMLKTEMLKWERLKRKAENGNAEKLKG
jgi:hypothetical protein